MTATVNEPETAGAARPAASLPRLLPRVHGVP
jgi:hypothetical protein